MRFPYNMPAPTYTETDIKEFLDTAAKEFVRLPGSKLVYPSGNGSSQVFMFGENPGAQDARNGEAFTGPFSQSFNETLLPSTGLTRETIYLSNLVKCNLPANREPTDEELDEWSPIMLAEIVWQKPRLVVAMGKFAAEFFLGKIKITQDHGHFYRVQLYNNFEITILVTLHPASAYHNEALMQPVKEDFLKLRDFLLTGEIGEIRSPRETRVKPQPIEVDSDPLF
jgi:uracil-DNA glycosylase family 4